MPFQDDSGIHLEDHQGPFWSAFAVFGSQLERMIALNVAWSIQLIPGMAGLMLNALPGVVRIVLIAYSAVAIPPATAVLYGVAARACDAEYIYPGLVRDMFDELARPGLKTLTPLLGSLGLIAWAVQQANAAGLLPVSVALQVWLIFTLVSANYWGPLFVAHPDHSPVTHYKHAMRLVWRYPAPTMLMSLSVLVTAVIGAISIGGLFLAIPVIMALLQMQMYRHLTGVT